MKKIVTIGLVGIMTAASLTGIASAQTKPQSSELTMKAIPAVRTQAAEEMPESMALLLEGTGEGGITIKKGTYMDAAELTNSVPAQAIESNAMVNETEQDFEVYHINGNNYLELRDIAKAVSESTQKFDITWDEIQDSINITTVTDYAEALNIDWEGESQSVLINAD
ncbi:MAG: hypothetical protein MJA31_08125 [Clostridia bacterium]|nr:hypothetical protein [Clostridia bacterium]